MPSADASQDYLSHYFDIPRYQWLFAGSIGLFVALFLLAFQPFGVNNFDPTFSIRLEFALAVAGFGAVITATVAANEFLPRPLVLRRLARYQRPQLPRLYPRYRHPVHPDDPGAAQDGLSRRPALARLRVPRRGTRSRSRTRLSR